MQDIAQRCILSHGDIVDGRFQIERELGGGTFGNVYSVVDSHRNVYALKMLRLWEVHPELRQGLIDRFDMEFETGRIESEYLVHSMYHGFVSGNPYIVMEFCGGGDLVEAAKHQQIDFSLMATCVLKGLRALHQNGKVHRDLKPENVLVKGNGLYALTDFGISGDRNKRMTERNILGRPKQLFGTYAYMPPEQLKPNHKDATVLPTTDIFSFGVMMYQIITGELPFGQLENESDLPSYMRNGREGRWDRDKLKKVGAYEWISLIEGCLTPKYTDRIQNTNEALSLVPGYSSKFDVTPHDIPTYNTKIVNGILLRIMQGEDYGREYRLDDIMNEYKPILRMGRKDFGVFNDIQIKEDNSCYISRYHCTIELDYDSGNWIIRDGQWMNHTGSNYWQYSTNGTYVNSTETTQSGMPIHPGDILSLGEVKIRVEAY